VISSPNAESAAAADGRPLSGGLDEQLNVDWKEFNKNRALLLLQLAWNRNNATSLAVELLAEALLLQPLEMQSIRWQVGQCISYTSVP